MCQLSDQQAIESVPRVPAGFGGPLGTGRANWHASRVRHYSTVSITRVDRILDILVAPLPSQLSPVGDPTPLDRRARDLPAVAGPVFSSVLQFFEMF